MSKTSGDQTTAAPGTVSLVDNPAPDAAWLALAAPERVLDPELPIIDAHHHIWDPRPWRYRLDDYRADAQSGHRIIGSVCVESGLAPSPAAPPGPRGPRELAEIGAMAGGATSGMGLCGAMVGFADLHAPDALPATLDALGVAAAGRLRGVRFNAAAHPRPEYRGRLANRPLHILADPALLRAIPLLGERGLIFETWVFFEQLDEVTRLAKAFPEVSFVIDHLGGPLAVGDYRPGATKEWREALGGAARCPNTHLKLGGLGMTALGAAFRHRPAPPESVLLASAWEELILQAIDLFGAERCMFESNFPVDKGQVSWVALWNAFKRITARLPATSRAALFAGTAARLYGMGPGVADD